MNFCTFDDVKEYIKDENTLFSYIDNPKTFMVELFPYYTDSKEGNLAKYARGKDYHVVVPEMLKEIINTYKIKYPHNNFVSFCDISPLPEVYIAYKSGAGILGRNGLIFDEKYGGYVFIGIIATDLEIQFEPPKLKSCIDCKLCEIHCPQGAISKSGVLKSKCLSFLTQENGEILNEQDIKKSQYIWGCDICLDICPMNKNPQKTDILTFKTELIYNLQLKDVKNLTRNQFKIKFFERAFTFRGTKPLERNLKIMSDYE
ncbi:MAG: QueG-associated DUF1730 domain-containing protein [Clostridia bacterium]